MTPDPFAGVIEAFETYRTDLFRYAANLVKRMGIQGGYGPEDVLGDVALIACQKAMTSPASVPRDRKALVAWLMRTALLVCLNHYRKSRTERRRADEYRAILQEDEVRNVLEEDPDALWSETKRLLGTLEREDARILELSFQENLTSAEIGQRLGMSAAAIRQRKSRILERLHAHLTR